MRRKVIAGNWKMNMLPGEAIEMINELTPLVKDIMCSIYRFILCTFNSTKYKYKNRSTKYAF